MERFYKIFSNRPVIKSVQSSYRKETLSEEQNETETPRGRKNEKKKTRRVNEGSFNIFNTPIVIKSVKRSRQNLRARKSNGLTRQFGVHLYYVRGVLIAVSNFARKWLTRIRLIEIQNRESVVSG